MQQDVCNHRSCLLWCESDLYTLLNYEAHYIVVNHTVNGTLVWHALHLKLRNRVALAKGDSIHSKNLIMFCTC